MHSTHPIPPRFRQAFALLLLLSFYPTTHAAKNESEDPDEPLPSVKVLEIFDSPRDAASEYVTRFGNWIDNFFADDRIYDEKQGSYIKLNVLQTYFENDKPVYDAQIKAKLDIPKTQNRLQLFVESVDEDADDTQQTSIDQTIEKQEQSIGLRFLNLDKKSWKITTIAGVRIHSGIDPLGRIRFRHLTEKDFWTYRFTESIFWFKSEGAGETSRFDMDHPLSKKLLFRSTTQATWKNINNFFDLGQDLILFQKLTKRKSLAYQIGGRAKKDAELYSTDYFYLVLYRQQVHKNWLFFEVSPAIHHPRDNDFKPIRSITLKFEIAFDAN